jgi:hypothetical protein
MGGYSGKMNLEKLPAIHQQSDVFNQDSAGKWNLFQISTGSLWELWSLCC